MFRHRLPRAATLTPVNEPAPAAPQVQAQTPRAAMLKPVNEQAHTFPRFDFGPRARQIREYKARGFRAAQLTSVNEHAQINRSNAVIADFLQAEGSSDS